MGGWVKTGKVRGTVAAAAVGWAVVAGVAGMAFGQAPSLTLIAPPPGRDQTIATAISADGRTVAGYARETGVGNYRAFTWTRLGGLDQWGNSVALSTQSLGISADGSISIGTRRFSDATSSRTEAYRYSTSGGYQTLGAVPAPFTDSGAQGVSGDGSVIVGALGLTGTSTAMRWTAAGGMENLGTARPGDVYSGFRNISRDGSTAIGISAPDFNGNEAYSWTRAGGWRHLPAPASAGPDYSATPGSSNFDGSLILGLVTGVGFPSAAVLWRNGTPSILPGYGPDWNMSPGAISDDGTIIIGQGRPSNIAPYVATLWLNGGGPTRLQDYLASLGVSIPSGLTLQSCSGISADGRTIVGVGLRGGVTQGFVATIPAPGGAGVALIGLAFLNGPRRRR